MLSGGFSQQRLPQSGSAPRNHRGSDRRDQPKRRGSRWITAGERQPPGARPTRTRISALVKPRSRSALPERLSSQSCRRSCPRRPSYASAGGQALPSLLTHRSASQWCEASALCPQRPHRSEPKAGALPGSAARSPTAGDHRKPVQHGGHQSQPECHGRALL